MIIEREHRRESINLTPTQEQFSRLLLEEIVNAGERQTLFVVAGLSGVGKTTVVEGFDRVLASYGATTEGELNDGMGVIAGRRGHLVVTALPDELDGLEQRLQRKRNDVGLQVIRLPGMDGQESLDFAMRLPRDEGSGLSVMAIARYSLGIPLLAKQLALPGVSKPEAVNIVARYLKKSFPRGYSHTTISDEARGLLQVPIPQDVLMVAEKMRSLFPEEQIYDHLNDVLEQQVRLASRGVIEESPFFVAPQSETLYDRMLQSSGRPDIDIFIPKLTHKDFERIQESLGYDQGRYVDQAPRMQMFLATHRKVSIWQRSQVGREVLASGGRQSFDKQVGAYLRAYQDGLLQLVPKHINSERIFLIHAHDHEHDTNPARIGWLTESLLQQRDIAYFVANQTIDLSYTYDPQHKVIKGLGKPFEWHEFNPR